jgi:hypothetical protein
MEALAFSELVIEPLTRSNWSTFTNLLDQGGRCWCVAPMGIDYRRRAVASNRADLRNAVKQGPPPGLLALRGEMAVGWCRVTPVTQFQDSMGLSGPDASTTFPSGPSAASTSEKATAAGES